MANAAPDNGRHDDQLNALAAGIADLSVSATAPLSWTPTPRASKYVMHRNSLKISSNLHSDQMGDDTGLPLIRYYLPEHYQKPELFPERWLPKSTANCPPAESMTSTAKFLHSANGLHAQLGEIQKHRVSRSHIIGWADDLRFVTWDSQAPLKQQASATTPSHPKDLFECHCGWSELASFSTLSGNEGCACSGLSNPRDTVSQKFRTVNAPGCRHFIAISYRWRYSDNSQGSAELVKTKYNDQSRSALHNVLDRSARFAEHHGYRLLWVDQVGIEQGNDVDKAIGIQAMDLVYEKAALCLALLEYEVTSQEQMDDLEHALAEGINPKTHEDEWRKWVEYLNISDLMRYAEAFKAVAEDEYFHRSWIAQENTVASATILLLRCNSALNKPDWMGDLDGEMQIPLCKFRMAAVKLQGAFQGYIEKEAWYMQRHLATIEHRNRRFDFDRSRHPDFHELRYGRNPTVALARFHTAMEPMQGWRKYMAQYRASQRDLTQHGRRKHSSAAEAVVFLATKQNFEVADRLAIVANLCGYEVRLDAQKLKRLGFDLGACILCLAVLNGDFSLARLRDNLTYKDFGTEPLSWEHITLQVSHGNDVLERIVEIDIGPTLFSWAPRIVEGFTEHFRHRQDDRRYDVEFLGEPRSRLCIRGFLWHRHRKINCEHLKSAFHERLPNASKREHEASLQERWSMPISDYLDCFWEITSLLRDDPELSVLAEELWLAFLSVKLILEHTGHPEKPEPPAVRSGEGDKLQQRRRIYEMSREEFRDQLHTTQGPIAYLHWMVQAIYMGDPLEVFKLDQQAEPEHEPKAHFAILNEKYGETIFTPGAPDRVTGSTDGIAASFGLPSKEQHSWIVRVDAVEAGETAAMPGGLPGRSIQLDKSPRAAHHQPNDPVKGFWGTSALPKSWFVLL